jgi:hypothetical protein
MRKARVGSFLPSTWPIASCAYPSAVIACALVSHCPWAPFRRHTSHPHLQSSIAYMRAILVSSTNRTTEIWGHLHPVFFPMVRTPSRILTKSDSMAVIPGNKANNLRFFRDPIPLVGGACGWGTSA